MILGAAVADAAVREFEWLDMHGVAGSSAVTEFLASTLTTAAALENEASQSSLKDFEIAFPPTELAEYVLSSSTHKQEEQQQLVGSAERAALLATLAATPLRHQSITGVMHHELLKVMMAARGEFEVDEVSARWVAVASAHPEAFLENHATLEHVLPILSPLPCIYPWADDESIWKFSSQFSDFLLAPLSSEASVDGEGGAAVALQQRQLSSAGASRMAQSIGLRFLQSNPNPVRNAMLQCSAVGGDAILPLDVLRLRHGHAAATTVSTSTVLSGVVDLVRHSHNYAHGMRKVIRFCAAMPASPTRKFCGPAMLAGALLGAKHGARSIPMEWLSATKDHAALGTIAVEVSQWAWNPSKPA